MKAFTVTNLLFSISCLLALSVPVKLTAQVNYVQNGGFETLVDTCVLVGNIKHRTVFWDTLRTGGGGIAYLCSNCSTVSGANTPMCANGSYQWPRTGINMVHFACLYVDPSNTWPRVRAYVQNEMRAPLIKDHTYCVRFYVNMANKSRYALTEIGAYLDDGTISAPPWGVALATPQVASPKNVYISDTLGWTEVQGTFVANGTEKYLTLGNFKSTAQTTYSTMPIVPFFTSAYSFYYFDDVSVIDADLEAFAGRDTFYTNPGDSVFIGRASEVGLDDRCTWYKLPNVTTPVASSVAGMYIQPQGVEQYMVRQEICGNVKYDTVTVYPGVLNVNDFLHSPLKLWPQPCSGSFELLLPMQGEYTVNIHNALGRLVHTQTLNQSRTVVTIETLPPGVYSLTVLSDNGLRWSRKLLVE